MASHVHSITRVGYTGNWTFRSQDHSLPKRKFQNWNFRSLELSLPLTFAPGSEWSWKRKVHNSRERKFFHWHCGYCTVGLYRIFWGLQSFLLSWPDRINIRLTRVDNKKSTSICNVHEAWPNNLDCLSILTRRLIFVDVITGRYRVTIDWSCTIDKTLPLVLFNNMCRPIRAENRNLVGAVLP